MRRSLWLVWTVSACASGDLSQPIDARTSSPVDGGTDSDGADQGTGDAGWARELIADDVMSDSGFAFGPEQGGFAYVAYTDYELIYEMDLWYAASGASPWPRQLLSPDVGYLAVPALALGQDAVHVVFREDVTVKYAIRSGDGPWFITDVVCSGLESLRLHLPAIVVRNSDDVVVLARGWDADDHSSLWVARPAGKLKNAWVCQQVTAATPGWGGPRAAVGADGEVHVADVGDGDLLHAWEHDGVWDVEVVADGSPNFEPGHMLWAVGIAAAPEAVFVSYQELWTEENRGAGVVARKTAEGWTRCEVDSNDTGSLNGAPKLAVDASGGVHAAYVHIASLSEPYDYQLFYGTYAAGEWRFQRPSAEGALISGGPLSLAFDGMNRPHLAVFWEPEGGSAGGATLWHVWQRP